MNESRGADRTPRDGHQYRHSNPKDRGKSRYRGASHRPYPPHNSRRPAERPRPAPPSDQPESSRYSKPQQQQQQQPSHHSVSRKPEKKPKPSRPSGYGADLPDDDREESSQLTGGDMGRRVEAEEPYMMRTSDRPAERKRKRDVSPAYHDRHNHRYQRNVSPSRTRDFLYGKTFALLAALHAIIQISALTSDHPSMQPQALVMFHHRAEEVHGGSHSRLLIMHPKAKHNILHPIATMLIHRQVARILSITILNTSHRGAHPPYRGGHYNQAQDRRISSTSAQGYGVNSQQHRRQDQFQNTQWMSAGRGRGQRVPAFQSQAASLEDRMSLDPPNHESQASRNFQESRGMDDNRSVSTEASDVKKMPPPQRQPNTGTPAKEGKFSFAFKKATPPTAPKPVPDLATRMREPPKPLDQHKQQPRAPLAMREREKHYREQHREQRRDDRRDARKYDRPHDRVRNDQQRVTNVRDRDRRDERYAESIHEDEPPVQSPPKVKVILKKVKPRPTLSEEFAQSDSVYFRKPGNESVIGAGTYGKVFKGIHVYTKQEVAMKKIRMEGEKDGFPITAVREIRLLQHLRHQNIVRLLEVMVEKNECFMVFEYLSHDLTGLINHPTFVLSAAHKKDLARQMFEGLRYLHHRGVLHRDIKAANILISNRGLLKFADFGLARFFSKSRQMDYTNRVITIWYRPPELLLGETRYGPAVDIWGAACVWMEMFTKKAVFPGDGGEISQIDKLYTTLGTPTKSDWPDILEMPWFELLRPTVRRKRVFDDLYRDVLSPAALDLVTQMFRYDPVKRPSADDVLNHPYFTSEEPAPQQAIELEDCKGDWHEFESKAARRERDKELKRAEYLREKEKRRAEASRAATDRDAKRMKTEEAGHSHSRPTTHASERAHSHQ
ncbi:kinase subunit of RNA polymerase II carboxy-terminal domain kinase I [Ascosphaera pollenicola]|nr:kinase subunit of RNA polymerase II carboxy-terminal domain kinase I [Ascosphaera pollenicola]